MATSPSLMFEEGIEALKGWFDMAALDYQAKLSANVTVPIPAGRVVRLNSAGEFETGVSATHMAIFVTRGSASYDVANPGTTPKGNFMHRAISNTGVMGGLVATGAYELASTEFDTARTYEPGDLLTATVANTNATTGGRLTNAGSGAGGDVKQFVDAACGVVSRGKYKNCNQVYELAFWPIYLPGAYA